MVLIYMSWISWTIRWSLSILICKNEMTRILCPCYVCLSLFHYPLYAFTLSLPLSLTLSFNIFFDVNTTLWCTQFITLSLSLPYVFSFIIFKIVWLFFILNKFIHFFIFFLFIKVLNECRMILKLIVIDHPLYGQDGNNKS